MQFDMPVTHIDGYQSWSCAPLPFISPLKRRVRFGRNQDATKITVGV